MFYVALSLNLLINRLLSSVYVLVNGIVLNRSSGFVKCLIARNNRFQDTLNKQNVLFITQVSIYNGAFL